TVAAGRSLLLTATSTRESHARSRDTDCWIDRRAVDDFAARGFKAPSRIRHGAASGASSRANRAGHGGIVLDINPAWKRRVTASSETPACARAPGTGVSTI